MLQLFVALALCLALVSAAVAQRPDAPLYAQPGPYSVGTREFTLADDSRPLTVTLWYPAPAEEVAPPHDYPLALAFSVPGRALLNAPVAAADAPFPLVIFSHGSGASRVLYLWLLEHLASQGFIVIAADHPGNTVLQTLAAGLNLPGSGQDFAGSYALRPRDVLRQLAFAEALNADGDFAGRIDTDQVAVMGHSFGGWTALAAGGAQMDFNRLRDYCAAESTAAADNVCFVLELESDIAAARGLSTAPAGTWPATTDPRVRAIIALAPWNAPLLDHSGITRPTLILVGSADDVTVPERDAYASFAALRAPATLVTFDHAGHYLFVDECPPVLLQFDAFSACSDPVWDMARAHDLSRHLITAFLRAHLQQDTAAAAALLPEQVSYPGVTYQVEAAGP